MILIFRVITRHYQFCFAVDEVNDKTITTNDPISPAVDKIPKESVEKNPNLDANEKISTIKGMSVITMHLFNKILLMF